MEEIKESQHHLYLNGVPMRPTLTVLPSGFFFSVYVHHTETLPLTLHGNSTAEISSLKSRTPTLTSSNLKFYQVFFPYIYV